MDSPDESDFIILFRHGKPMCGVYYGLEPFTVARTQTPGVYTFSVNNSIFTMDDSGRLWDKQHIYQVWDLLHNPHFHGLARCEKMTVHTRYVNTADR